MATIAKQTIYLDLRPGAVMPVLHVSQGDSGLETLEFKLINEHQPWAIPSAVTDIQLNGATPVGVFSYNDPTWSGNTVTANVTETMTAEKGVVICELRLLDVTLNSIGTLNFVISVEPSPYTNAHVSTSDMAVITAALNAAQQNLLLSKSWAVGDTGIRDGENTNNSKYYADQSRIEGNGLASVFSDVLNYSAGDYVIHDGILYEFIADHNAGAWNSNEARIIIMGDEVADLKDHKVQKFATCADMKASTALKSGMVCRTAGYYSVNDGGAALYYVMDAAPVDNYYETLQNGLIGVLVANDFVTPEMFGAYGDGEHDDTTAFQTMFDSGSNHFELASKIYKISAAITLNHKCTVTGQGASTLFQSTKRANIFTIEAADVTVDTITFKSTGEGFEDEAVEGAGAMIRAKGKKTRITNCSFIDANYVGVFIDIPADYSNVDSCYFGNCWAEGISYQAKYGVIQNCGFYQCKYNGAVLRGAEGVQIDNCKFIDCAVTDVAIDFHEHHNTSEYTKDCVISNCVIIGAYIAISMVGTDLSENYFENIILKNNIIKDSRSTGNIGIRIYYAKDVTVEGNVIEDSGNVYSLLLSAAKDISVVGNLFKRSEKGTTAVYSSSKGILKFMHNTFKNYDIGLRLESPGAEFDKNFLIANNVFSDCTTGLSHKGNYGRTLTIQNNTFLGGTTDIDLAGGCGTVELVGNILNGSYVKTISAGGYIQSANYPLDRADKSTSGINTGYTGQYIFATNLGYPLFYNGTNWVDATGRVVI